MALKKISEMEESELRDILITRFKFDEDEVNTLFRKEEDLRAAVRDAIAATRAKLSDTDESAIGWDSNDDTKLTKDQEALVKRNAENEARAKKAAERIKEQVDDLVMQTSIDQTKSGLTMKELKASRDDIKKLLAELDEEEEDD